MLKELLIIFLGGGIGSAARYGVQLTLRNFSFSAGHFPWGTFLVNLTGSFLIGLFYAFSERFHLSTELRLLLTTGICGGFTTFSTFSHDSLALLRNGSVLLFFLYVLLSVTLGLVGVLLGSWCVK